MKVLCKQDYYSFDKKKHFWTKDKLYNYDERCGACPHKIISVESNLHTQVTEDTSIFYKNFQKLFYSPEETINLLRTKLIDDILDDN